MLLVTILFFLQSFKFCVIFVGKDFREQINELTSFIDLGNVYGNSYLVSKAMEAGVYGESIDCCICI